MDRRTAIGPLIGLCVAALLGVFASDARAQPGEYVFQEIRLPGGSLGNRVISMAQDQRGYMWFGSWSGLHRYDGHDFVSYTHDGPDSSRLPARWVEALAVDSTGDLWIGTYGGGLARLDAETETITSYRRVPGDERSLSSDSVTVIHIGRSNTVWIGTLYGGLLRYNRETDDFTRFKHDPDDPSTLSDDQIRAIHEDRNGMLWIGTNSGVDLPDNLGGLNSYDPESNTFTRYLANPNDPKALSDRHVEEVYEDSRGRLWVGTAGNGLYTMDRERGVFTRHEYDPQQPNAPRPVTSGNFDFVSGGFDFVSVAFIHEDSAGRIWFGSWNGGLGVYDQENETYHELLQPEGAKAPITTAFAFFESRDRALWVSTLDELYRVGPAVSELPYEFVGTGEDGGTWSIHQDAAGETWLGTGWVLLRMREGEELPYLGAREQWIASGRALEAFVYEMVEGESGNLWMLGSKDDELVLLSHVVGEALLPKAIPLDDISGWDAAPPQAGPSLLPAWKLLLDSRGGSSELWIGGAEGVYLVTEPESCFLEGQVACSAQKFIPNPGGTAASNGVLALGKDGEGRLLAGTQAGLYRMNGLDGSFERYVPVAGDPGTISDSTVTSIFTDSRGRLWVGTLTGGLNLAIDNEDGSLSFARYTSATSPLPNDLVASIVEDSEGNLWLHQGDVVTRVDPERNQFRTYDVPYGPTYFDQAFVKAPASRSADGKLFFGGDSGLSRFHPQQLAANSTIPELTLTGLRILNSEVFPGRGAVLQKPIWKTTALTLRHDQNVFALRYTAFDYLQPDQINYRFMLDGWEDDWRAVGTLREAAYAGIPPGNYTFRVQARGRDGIWSEERSILVSILPPWWRTTWAYVLYGLLLAGSIFGIDRVQRRRVIAKERERSRERELEQAREIEQAYHQLEETHRELKTTQQQLVQQEKMASLGQLTAGIAHEIKNPLNFVNNFAGLSNELTEDLEMALEAGDSDEVKAIVADLRLNTSKIREHGQRADGIVRSMMQHARGGSTDRAKVELNALVQEHLDLAYHGKRAQSAGFTATIATDLDEDVGEVLVVPQEIGRVIINLVVNAFDAVEERAEASTGQYQPQVSVSTKRTSDRVEIRVADNGLGIPEPIRAKIFDPFFTTKPTGRGTGLGLSLSYDIITAGHGGKLTVESPDGGGTTFIVCLPAS